MAETGLLTNAFSGEHQTKKAVREAVEKIGYTVESYSLTDKAQERILTAKLDTMGGEDQPQIFQVIWKALAKEGYELEKITVTIKAIKDITNQTVMNFNLEAGQHPDNV